MLAYLKCRFIVEKQIGMIKNFKALDNIRNTQAGHIQIDYRIACAMLNFTHISTCPDKQNLYKIASKLKEKVKIDKNPLSYLLTKHLDTKEITPVDLGSITDFPKLNSAQLIRKIFLGTFQLKQSKSYVSDIIKNGKAYTIPEKLLSKLKNKTNKESKIIALEIVSRHKRSEKKVSETCKNQDYMREFRNKYKIFLEYVPSWIGSKSIKGFHL